MMALHSTVSPSVLAADSRACHTSRCLPLRAGGVCGWAASIAVLYRVHIVSWHGTVSCNGVA